MCPLSQRLATNLECSGSDATLPPGTVAVYLNPWPLGFLHLVPADLDCERFVVSFPLYKGGTLSSTQVSQRRATASCQPKDLVSECGTYHMLCVDSLGVRLLESHPESSPCFTHHFHPHLPELPLTITTQPHFLSPRSYLSHFHFFYCRLFRTRSVLSFVVSDGLRAFLSILAQSSEWSRVIKIPNSGRCSVQKIKESKQVFVLEAPLHVQVFDRGMTRSQTIPSSLCPDVSRLLPTNEYNRAHIIQAFVPCFLAPVQ